MIKQGKTINMTEGSPLKIILAFAVPLFIGNIFQQIYSAVDTMVAGYSLGDNAIAAIGATSALYSLIIDLATGMNSGYAIVISQSYGASDTQKMKRSIAGAFMLNTVVTVLLTVIAVIFLKPLMAVMKTPTAIFDEAYSYMIVICGGMAFTVLYNTFAGILRALGNSRLPLYCLIVSCVVNICLDLLFILVFKWGVAGAAYATICAQAVSAIVCGGVIFTKYRHILPKREHFKIPKDLFANLLATGTSMGLMYCVVDFGSIFFQRANNALGENIISAHTAARRLMVILMQPLATIATASSTFVSQNYGAKLFARIKSALKQVFLMEVGWSLICCAVIWLGGGAIVKLMTGTRTADVISNAELHLRCHISLFPVLGVLLALRTAMQGMGKKIAPIVSSVIELILKIISATWIIPVYGYVGTCLTEPIVWVAMLTFLLIAYLIQRKKIFAEVKEERQSTEVVK